MTLPPDECHVWWLRSPAVPAELETLLDPAERGRLRRLRRPADQQSYLAAHALARLVLGRYLGHDPGQVQLGARCGECGGTDHGKPMLLHPGDDLEFSLSHSGRLVVVAVARGAPVGVDVEAIDRHGDYAEIAAHVLSPSERDAVLALAETDRAAAFVRYWARKEAVLKAVGVGLARPPSALTVSGPAEPARVLDWPDRPEGPKAFHLDDLDPGPGYAACVALAGWAGGRVMERDGGALLSGMGSRRSTGPG